MSGVGGWGVGRGEGWQECVLFQCIAAISRRTYMYMYAARIKSIFTMVIDCCTEDYWAYIRTTVHCKTLVYLQLRNGVILMVKQSCIQDFFWGRGNCKFDIIFIIMLALS